MSIETIYYEGHEIECHATMQGAKGYSGAYAWGFASREEDPSLYEMIPDSEMRALPFDIWERMADRKVAARRTAAEAAQYDRLSGFAHGYSDSSAAYERSRDELSGLGLFLVLLSLVPA